MKEIAIVTASVRCLHGVVMGAAIAVLVGCGGSSAPRQTPTVVVPRPRTSATTSTTAAKPPTPPPKPAPPQVLGAARGSGATGFVPAVRWRGQTAIFIARSPAGVALLSLNQRWVTLALHSGTVDAGSSGWRYGPAIAGAERGRLVAAFNGAFKFNTGAGGFESYGRVGAPLQSGRASIVTYTDGFTDIGSWHQGVPAPGRAVASVRQNLSLLIDGGRPAPNVDCVSCWGATLGGVSAPARGALGITASGNLIWAGGEHLTVAGLVDALLGARVVRAVELDINPEWVAAYLYARGAGGHLTPVPVLSDQSGVPGFFLEPYSRDFFTVLVR